MHDQEPDRAPPQYKALALFGAGLLFAWCTEKGIRHKNPVWIAAIVATYYMMVSAFGTQTVHDFVILLP